MGANKIPWEQTNFGNWMTKNDGRNQQITSFLSSAASGVGKTMQAMKNANKGTLARPDEGALAIRDAQYSALKSIPGPVGAIAGIAEGVDNILGGITGGLGSATKADKVLSAIPLLGNTAAIFAGKVDKIKGNVQDINTGDFGGSVASFQEAEAMAGGKSLAARKLNKKVAEAQRQFDLTSSIIDDNKKRLNNSIGQDLLARNVSKYSGNQQFSLLGRKGMKFSSLDAARDLLSRNNDSNKDVKKFQSGGKIEKENIIPTGAMHKNLHHIEDVNPDLEGKITSKGIPVVTMDEGGEIKSQQAEIESNEWTLSLSVTQQIEEYWNNYKESKDDNIAIECGKYLVDQIFNNTRDDGKVIKKTE